MEELQTIRWKPIDAGRDVARFVEALDSRTGDEIIVRKSKETAEIFIYIKRKDG